MESTPARITVALLALVVVVVAYVVLAGGSKDDPAPATDGGMQQTVTIKDGEPEGGIVQLSYTTDDEIDILVRSDTAGEIHLHGFDVMQDVEAGGTTEFQLPADLEGEFEMELEDTKTQIAELTVNP